MSDFVVSARKYRPSTFEEVVGQGHITKTLQNEITNDHLAQAFLFCGPRGVGKTTCARILAREINKEAIDDESYDYSFNIFELDAASNNSVDDIRLLNEQVRIPPQVGNYKVYIIDEVHMLSTAAFNAFLKTLEEPPPYAIFILATTERHKILPTILSRCQIFNFNRISVKEIVEHLKGIGEKENIKADEEALHIIAQKADGALRDALSIFDQMASMGVVNEIRYSDVIENLNVLDYDIYFKITSAFLDQDISAVLLQFDEVLDRGFEGHIFLNGLANHFRDLMVCKDPRTAILLEVPPTIKEEYQKIAGKIDQGFLVNAIQIVNSAELGYKASHNHRLHVELALVKMCYLPSLIESAEKKNFELKIAQIEKELLGLPVKTSSPPPKEENKDEITVPAAKAELVVEEHEPKAETPPKVIEKASKPEPTGETIQFQNQGFKVPVTPSGEVASLASLANIMEGTDGTNIVESASAEPVQDRDLTEEEILEGFDQFKIKASEMGRKSLVSLFKIINPQVRENTLTFEVTTTLLMQLEDIRSEMIQFIREKLGSSSFTIEFIEVEKKQEGNRAYTNHDKFDAMVEKNPLIGQLREKLNLEFD